MGQIHVESSGVIDARPEDVYAVLSDYHVGHPAIVPKQYFTELTVMEGGTGAGTVIRVGMKIMGRENHTRMFVSEPEPGRLLVEANEEEGLSTSFRLDPIDSGSRTLLTLATDIRGSSGMKGLLERLLVPIVLRRIYKKELAQINEYMALRNETTR